MMDVQVVIAILQVRSILIHLVLRFLLIINFLITQQSIVDAIDLLVYTMTTYQLTNLAQVCILHTTNNYVVKTMLLHKQMKLLLLLLASEC